MSLILPLYQIHHLNGNIILHWKSFPYVFVLLLLKVLKIISIPGGLKFLNNMVDVLVSLLYSLPNLLCWAHSSSFQQFLLCNKLPQPQVKFGQLKAGQLSLGISHAVEVRYSMHWLGLWLSKVLTKLDVPDNSLIQLAGDVALLTRGSAGPLLQPEQPRVEYVTSPCGLASSQQGGIRQDFSHGISGLSASVPVSKMQAQLWNLYKISTGYRQLVIDSRDGAQVLFLFLNEDEW